MTGRSVARSSTTKVVVISDRRLQIVAVAVGLVGTLPLFLTGALAVQIGRDMQFSAGRLGLASGGFFGAAAASSAVMGRLAERIGPGQAMRIAAAISVTSQVLISLAPRYAALVALLGLAGVGNSLAQVGANLLIAKRISPGRQGWALALKQSGMPAGAVLAGLAVPAFGVTVGWRWAFVMGAVAAVFVAVAAPVGAVPPGGKRDSDRRVDVPLGRLAPLAVAAALAAAANGTLAMFVVSAGVNAGLTESYAGLVLTVGSIVGISMRLLVGAQADRRGERHLPVVAALLAGGAVGYLLLVPGAVVGHLLGALLAFGLGWAWPGLFNLAVVRLNPTAPAAATGITQTGAYFGSLTGPVAFGLVVDHSGYGPAWAGAGLLSATAAVAVLLGRRWVLAWPAGKSATRSDDKPPR